MSVMYITGDKGTDRIINKLAKKYSTPATEELYRQMFTTVVKLHIDDADTGDLKLLNTSFKELRHAFRIFKRYRTVKKVAVFGSARIESNTKEYKDVMKFSRMISELGFMVITGGGGGVMEAGNKGALPGKSFAVNIKLPFEQRPNTFIKQAEKLLTFNYFFTRKLIFIKESDATVLFPGGFGTNDEAFEALTLVQTGKGAPRPIVFVDTGGKHYWNSWFRIFKKVLVGQGLISPEDLKLFTIVSSPEAAVKAIAGFYKVYHSTRYVGGKLVIRLKKALTSTQMKRLNKKYSDILVSGQIECTGALPEEVRGKDHIDLPRIILYFNKHDHGRLFEMIREINSY
ncbi:TIGR00730 family Rossman fold protein [Candidatus Margulisiibacteriota bacterium]